MVTFGSGQKHRYDKGPFAIFVLGADSELSETEELACLIGMKGMTTTEDLHSKIKKVLPTLTLPLHRLVRVVMDGVPCTAGRNSGLSLLITKKCEKYSIP
jgi:hypothetical protein